MTLLLLSKDKPYSLLQIPFPRPFISVYLIAALVTGLSIAFTLIVFQPFGTEQFQHEYKTLILSGYGIVAAVSIALYYALSIYLINKRREPDWTIVHESIDLFICVIFALMMTYLYFTWVFGYEVSLRLMANFLIRASSVSIMPIMAIYAYLYYQYHDLRRSSIQFQSSSSGHQDKVILKGSNKEDVIETSMNYIRFAKAEDNYVIMYLLDQGAITRHMIRSTMKDLLAQMDPDLFYQCHRSYIINLSKVISIVGNKNETKVELADIPKTLPVSRSKVDDLKHLVSSQST